MRSVKLIVSDSKIWNKDQAIFELIDAAKQGPVNIDLLHEGPCCQTSGINSLLDLVVDYTGCDKSTIFITTSNQLASSPYTEVRKSFVELDLAKKILQNKIHVPSTLKKTFGIFIGRSNWARLGIASHLHTRYYEKTNITFHYDPLLDFFNENFGIEELITKNWNQCNDVFKFLSHLPIKNDQQGYPILWNKGAYNLDDQYRDIFCEVVCETFFTGKVFFFTEKLMRCILNRRPFIVQGPRYFLKNLKKLGFQTFDYWWDEGYSDDPTDATITSLKQNIDWIAEQSPNTISEWYAEMQPLLEHNFNILKNLTNTQITTTEFYYD
jgi:hypothetical protein